MEQKEGYILKDQRKKILLICDDIRVHSGVATIARELVINTAHHFNWVNLGGAVTHPDKGKRYDLSEDTNHNAGITDASVFLYPVDGFGNPEVLRHIITLEKPDAVMLITDPRYFEWLFSMENEIRRTIPIIYLNIWDNGPAPLYNKSFYESCDALLAISKQTKLFNELVLDDKKDGKIIEYCPHGVNENIFKPLEDTDPELVAYKKQILGDEEKDFILFFNSRNIRRKQIPDTMLAFKYFLDSLPKEKADKCLMILHTEVISEHGTDLEAVRKLLFKDYPNAIKFSSHQITNTQLNVLYNIADAQILLSSNEGWGLSITEAILAGTPVIANVTGGIQDQMRFVDESGEWFIPTPKIPSNHTARYVEHGKWAFPVYPSNRSIQGSPTTPYIWDDRCKPEDASIRIFELYSQYTREERKAIGLQGREWALGEAGFTSKLMSNKISNSIDDLFSSWTPRENYEVISINTSPEPELNQSLLY